MQLKVTPNILFRFCTILLADDYQIFSLRQVLVMVIWETKWEGSGRAGMENWPGAGSYNRKKAETMFFEGENCKRATLCPGLA